MWWLVKGFAEMARRNSNPYLMVAFMDAEIPGRNVGYFSVRSSKPRCPDIVVFTSPITSLRSSMRSSLRRRVPRCVPHHDTAFIDPESNWNTRDEMGNARNEIGNARNEMGNEMRNTRNEMRNTRNDDYTPLVRPTPFPRRGMWPAQTTGDSSH